MLILILKNLEEIGARSASIVENAIRRKPDLVLGLPTGSTPIGFYRDLVRRYREGRIDFSKVRTFNLDEYLGIPPSHPASYHRYMGEQLLDHVNIDPANVHIPDGFGLKDVEACCSEYEDKIRKTGGIDLQVLGIGKTGHIGFNEPTSSLASRTRIKTLTEQTRRDNSSLFGSMEKVPECAITMGIGTILEARKILLLASGAAKAEAIAKAVEGPVASSVTASALQLHPDVMVLLDDQAASRLTHHDYYNRVIEMTSRLTPHRLE